MKETTPNSTEAWIFPDEPAKIGPRPVFPETPIQIINGSYLSKSRLRARKRRHERVIALTSRAR